MEGSGQTIHTWDIDILQVRIQKQTSAANLGCCESGRERDAGSQGRFSADVILDFRSSVKS